jgi:hypothetical protein
MRVVSMLTALLLGLGCAACGGGGGPSDLSLGGPTSAPVTTTTAARTTTSAPAGSGRALAARARFAQLAVYNTPDAPEPTRVLDNPWKPKDAPRERIPQVLLVQTRRADGWIKVLLPSTPQPTDGWVRAFDVKVTPVAYRLRVALGAHSVTVFKDDRPIFQSQIRVVAAQAADTQPGAYYLRRVIPARAMETTQNPYAYRFVAKLVTRVPLGAPVEITVR